MNISDFEISWRVGDRQFTLQLDSDGVPSLAGAPLPETERRPGRNARRGLPWSEGEEEQLRSGHAAGTDPAEVARAIGRSEGAVRARLVWLGLVEPEAANLRYPVRPREPVLGRASESA